MRKTVQRLTQNERQSMFDLLDRLESVTERNLKLPSIMAIEYQNAAEQQPATFQMLQQAPSAFFEYFEVEGMNA